MHVLYVSKLPPSRSGVARYAAQFSSALHQLGQVECVVTGHESDETTRLGRIVTVVRAVRRGVRSAPDVVVFELSGRAIAEVVASALLLLRRRRKRPVVWVTVHDPPAVTGGLFWLALLDRKGLRRIAAWLSRTVGRRIERAVLRRADIVVCLSRAGADALVHEGKLDRIVETIPPVAQSNEPGSVRRQVFMPGPIETPAGTQVLRVVAAHEHDAKIVVGYCDRSVRSTLRDLAGELAIADRLEFAGMLDQDELSAQYAVSAVVVYWRDTTHAAVVANWAACSYPVVDALANGCALVTNAARGAGEYVRASGAIDLSDAPERLPVELGRLLASPAEVAALGNQAREYATREFSESAVAARVTELLSSPDAHR